MKVLEVRATPARDERPSSQVLHDDPDARVVAFHLLPGQEVAAHRSPSTVLVQVVEGSGTFVGRDGEARLGVGDAAVYSPNEVHAIRASEGPLRFLAILTPRPS